MSEYAEKVADTLSRSIEHSGRKLRDIGLEVGVKPNFIAMLKTGESKVGEREFGLP